MLAYFYRVDLRHGVDEDDREYGEAEPEEERARDVPLDAAEPN